MTDKTMTREEGIAKLKKLVEDIDIGMLTTVDTDGSLKSRPMQAQQFEDDGTLWLFTAVDSPKVKEIKKDHEVNLAFSSPSDQNYVSLSGTAELVRDQAKIDELWSPQNAAWFPNGKDDPNVGLLKISVSKAEYWDSPSSAIAHVISLASAMLTGKPADPGDTGKVDLKA